MVCRKCQHYTRRFLYFSFFFFFFRFWGNSPRGETQISALLFFFPCRGCFALDAPIDFQKQPSWSVAAVKRETCSSSFILLVQDHSYSITMTNSAWCIRVCARHFLNYSNSVKTERLNYLNPTVSSYVRANFIPEQQDNNAFKENYDFQSLS